MAQVEADTVLGIWPRLMLVTLVLSIWHRLRLTQYWVSTAQVDDIGFMAQL